VIAKGEMFNIMYSFGLLIVDLETARSRLVHVFEVPDGTPACPALASSTNQNVRMADPQTFYSQPYCFAANGGYEIDERKGLTVHGSSGSDIHEELLQV
jgi:hypothetical protein